MDVNTLQNQNQLAASRRPLILAVDDHEDNLLLLAQILSMLEGSYLTAIDGETALSLAQQHQPDLILLDIMLPDLDGLEVIQRLQEHPLTRSIPVIAVTALAKQEDRDRLLLAGCAGYISKPYLIDELEALIHHHLQDYMAES